MESNNANFNGENVVAILKIIKIEFKMILQSFFGLKFFQVPAKLDFPYLSPHISEWNESKLPMLIKI